MKAQRKRKLKKIVAFIPLRSKSKRIKGKNIKKIAGKPLAFWVIKAVLGCELIETVFVSTNSYRIRRVISKIKNDKLKIISRSKETTSDTASTESAMLEFAKKYSFDCLVLIQATSPLLQKVHLKEGINKYLSSGCDSLLSVVRQKRFIWNEYKTGLKPVNYNLFHRPRGQDSKGFLVENGAFYITSRQSLLETKCRISGRICAYEMPEESYFEADTMRDWEIVECLLEKFKKTK